MKQLFTILVLLAVAVSDLSAQKKPRSAYQDAVFLKSEIDKNKGKFGTAPRYGDLIKYYFKASSQDSLDDIITHNPFLKPYYKEGGAQGLTAGSIPGAISQLGGLDVTTIADGLAKFLVQRTKEELSVAFFSQLKQDMASEKYEALRTLFPQTWHLLQTIDQNIYQFSVYLTDLRNAFNADLANIPTTLPYVLNLPEYQQYFADKPWILRAMQTSAFVADVLTSKNEKDSLLHAGKLIEKINANMLFPLTDSSTTDTNINGAIKTMQLLSRSFRALDSATNDTSDADKYWVSGHEILQTLDDTTTLSIYLGLLYHEAINDSIYFSDGYSLRRILDTIATHRESYNRIRGSIAKLTMQFNLFDQEWKTLKEIKQGTVKDSAYIYYDALFNTGIDILTTGLGIAEDFTTDVKIKVPAAFWVTTDRYISALHDASDIFIYVNQKKYALAVTSLTSFLNNVIPDSKSGKAAKVIEKVNTYGTFMAQVATAKTSDEVDSIITRTVLPVGSSYIKKHSRFNIALNGYVGLYVGQQRQSTDEKFVGVAGVYAPIGLAFSWGLPWLNIQHNPSSISLFASIIDLGPLVSFRFTNYNDTLANNVNIRLNQILSPGVHAVIGLPKLPLSLGGGINWTPLITNVEKDKITTIPDNKPALRYELFLAVDIPLLNFHNNPR